MKHITKRSITCLRASSLVKAWLVAVSVMGLGTAALAKSDPDDGTHSTSKREIPTAFWGDWHESADEACDATSHGLMQVDQMEFDYPMANNQTVRTKRIVPGKIRVQFEQKSVDGKVHGASEVWTLTNEDRTLTITPVKTKKPLNGVTQLYRCVEPAQR